MRRTGQVASLAAVPPAATGSSTSTRPSLSGISKSATLRPTRSRRMVGSPGHRPSATTTAGSTSAMVWRMLWRSAAKETGNLRPTTRAPSTVMPSSRDTTSPDGLSPCPAVRFEAGDQRDASRHRVLSSMSAQASIPASRRLRQLSRPGRGGVAGQRQSVKRTANEPVKGRRSESRQRLPKASPRCRSR